MPPPVVLGSVCFRRWRRSWREINSNKTIKSNKINNAALSVFALELAVRVVYPEQSPETPRGIQMQFVRRAEEHRRGPG